MGIFHKSKAAVSNTVLPNGIQLNSSDFGQVIPVLIGPNRVPMKVIWAGDWKDTPTTTPGQHVGKGIGGSSTPGQTTHNYSTACLSLLGFGPADRIDSFWTNSGKIGVTQISTSTSVPASPPYHIDIVDSQFSGDYGVGLLQSYSHSVNDFGSPGSRTLSGSFSVPMTKGSVVGPGVYVISVPVAGTTRYEFDSSDAGAAITINYTSLLGTLFMSDELVLSGAAYSTANPSTFLGPNGATQVIDQGTGNAFVLVGSSPASGQFTCSTSGVFGFNPADNGTTFLIRWQESDPNVDTANATVNFSLANGTAGQSPWSYLSSTHPDQALGYTGMALWEFPSLSLGSSNSMPQLIAEPVMTFYMQGGGIAGANPADVIGAILQDTAWGIGLDPALIGDWSNARAFWQANGFFISLNQDTQSTAQDVINAILDAGQAVMFWAEGQLQIAVYGDTSVAGFGAIYEPDTQPVVEFDVTDFVAGGGQEPIKVESEPQNHVYNRVKVEWMNALVDYRTEVLTEEDSASIQQNGLYEEGQQSWDFIRFVNIAQWAANLRLKRYTNIRDTYTWTVPTRYRPLLRLMKLVTVTWDHMGWSQKPLRITKIEDTHQGLQLTMEEFPYGVAQATIYPKLTVQAINKNPALISPGNTTLVAFEEPEALNSFAGNVIRIYADSETPENWGGTEVYVSGDDVNFTRLGEITSPEFFGTLGGSGMTTGTGDPDTQTISITGNNDVLLESATSFDFANSNALMAIVDSGGTYEIVAYKNVTLTGASTYDVDTFHRGLFGTTRASHAAGSLVIQMGENFLKWQFPSDQTGNTAYFRGASYNKLMGRLQDITTLTSVVVTLSGTNPGLFTNGALNYSQAASKIIYSDASTVQLLQPQAVGGETDGYQVLTNPDFASGSTTGYSVYDNNSTGHVTISTVADAAVQNSSGFKLKVHVTGGGESPGLGGFFVGIPADGGSYAVNTYHQGSTYIWRIKANVPVGHNIQFASNAYGTGGTFTWLTPQTGTGGWTEYVGKQVIGVGGSFSTTGFFYIDGSFVSTFDWFVAMVSLVGINLPQSISVDQHPRVQYLDNSTGQMPTSTMANPQFSLLPGQSVAFTASESPTSITYTWGTQTLTRPDQSTLTLTAGSFTFSGLANSTLYYSYPYLTLSGSTVVMNWVSGSSGAFTTPTSSLAMQGQFDGRFSLGVIHDTTQSGGGTGGGGGGGDPGGACPSEEDLAWVKRGDAAPVRMRMGDVVHGDLIKGWSFVQQADVWRMVKAFRHSPSTMWFKVNGYNCSPCETVYVNGEWQMAFKVPGAQKVRGVSLNRVEISVEHDLTADMQERNYWLDDGVNPPLLMHNFVIERS